MKGLNQTQRALSAPLVFAVALLLSIAGLHGVVDFQSFDSRFALFAKEMLRHGPDWFPTTYGVAYPDYPATSTFLIYLVAKIAGHIDLQVAVLPSAIAVALTLTMIWNLLAPINIRWAIASLSLCLMSIGFLTDARSISLDHEVAACAMASFLAARQHLTQGQWRYLIVAWGCSVLAFSIRGPLGLVVSTAAAIATFLPLHRWRLTLGYGIACLSTLIGLWFLLLFLAHAQGGQALVDDVLRMQVTGRLEELKHNSAFFYITDAMGGYAIAYPVALLSCLYLVKPARLPSEHRVLLLQLGVMAVLIITGLSLPNEKKLRYLLPAIAPLCAIGGYVLTQAQGQPWRSLQRVFNGVLMVIPCVLIALSLYARAWADKHGFGPIHAFPLIITALVALQCANGFAATLRVMKPWASSWRWVAAALSFWIVYSALVEPTLRDQRNTRNFTQAVEAARQAHPAPLVLVNMGRDANAIKYMVNTDSDFQPQFLASTALASLSVESWIVIESLHFSALPVSLTQRCSRGISMNFDSVPYHACLLTPEKSS